MKLKAQKDESINQIDEWIGNYQNIVKKLTNKKMSL